MTYTNAELELIADRIRLKAAKASSDASLGGHMHDGGATEMKARHSTWLDGYLCGTGERDQSNVYHSIIEKSRQDKDPEYQQYLKLKEKFEPGK